MAQAIHNLDSVAHGTRVSVLHEVRVNPSYAAYVVLHIGFTVLPIIAGADKFLDRLVNWDQYLSATYAAFLGASPHAIMMGVGAIEIVAGFFVAFAPQFGAYVVMLWLWGIIANLLLLPGYFDVALRDFGLSLAALALAQLSRTYHHH
jgi:hypothetical protein